MIRREFLQTIGAAAAASALPGGGAAAKSPSTAPPPAAARVIKYDLHTHFYPQAFFDQIRAVGGEFAFTTSPTGQTIITYGGARFFGITPPMTDVAKRLEDMDRVGIDVEVISLSTPNIFFADAAHQPGVARMVNDAYAKLMADHPARFKAFASIPMDAPDEALKELHRAIGTLKMNGVILLTNIRGRALTEPAYRPFFEEANRMKLCVFLHPMIPTDAEPFREYVLGPIIGFPFDTTLAVARMCYDGLFRDFPDIRWVVAHAGGAVPFLMERMDMVTGSDYPHLLGSIERAVSSVETFEIPDQEKREIFSGTALRILNNV